MMTSNSDQSADVDLSAQAAKELANLLGRELVLAKKKVSELELEVAKSKQEYDQSRVKRLNSSVDTTAGVAKEIQEELDRYKREKEEMEKVLVTLKSQKKNFKSEENKIKILHCQLSSLKDQCSQEQEQKKKLKKSHHKLTEHITALHATIEDLKSTCGERRALKDCMDLLGSLPMSPDRPNQSGLFPISRGPANVLDLLNASSYTQGFMNKYLFLPGRTLWCSSRRGNHHAIGIAPTHTFDIYSRKWLKTSCFSELYGQTQEFFYKEKGDIFYAGTYRCIQLHETNWPESHPEIIPYVVAEVSMSKEYADAPCSNVHKGTISKLYREGVLKIECMGLQCVGFNSKLYETLLSQAQLASSTSSLGKRKSSHKSGVDKNDGITMLKRRRTSTM